MFSLQPTRQDYSLLPHDPNAFEDEGTQHRPPLSSAAVWNLHSLWFQVHHLASLTWSLPKPLFRNLGATMSGKRMQHTVTTDDDIVEEPEHVDIQSSRSSNSSCHGDPEMHGLTLYEKKALLVNRELTSQGMGKYQWMIFVLCGFGYLLDLLWAQAFGLILASIKQEFGFSDTQRGNLGTCFSAGLTAGAFVFGVVVDIIGRYWAFNLTVLTSSIFGICLGIPDSYNTLLVLTALVGLGIGGNIPIDTTICLEMLPHKNRWLLPTLSIFQPLGVVLCSAIAYGYIPNFSCVPDLESCNIVTDGGPCCSKADNWGWRYLMFTLGVITIFVFFARFALFRFQESPTFLLYRGKDGKAVEVLQYIARYNNVPCNITLESFSQLDEDEDDLSASGNIQQGKIVLGSGDKLNDLTLGQKAKLEFIRLKVLFSTPLMAWLTVCVWIIYMWDFWGFTIAGYYLPSILRQKGTELGLSLEQTYRSYIYIYLFGIPGVLAGTTIYKWRRSSMILSSALFGAMLFTFTAVNSQASYIGINGLVYFFQSMFNAILYGATPELFPAPVRGT
jgi:MFS family permease